MFNVKKKSVIQTILAFYSYKLPTGNKKSDFWSHLHNYENRRYARNVPVQRAVLITKDRFSVILRMKI